MRFVALIAGFFVLLAVLPSAQAAKVNGKITITKEFVESLVEAERNAGDKGRAFYWNEPNGIADVRPPRISLTGDVAVVLAKEGGKDPAANELDTVKVHAGGLERKVVVTRPGSTIRFRNVDPFDHELYSPGLPAFKPELQSNGSFRPIEFAKEGVFEVRCKRFNHFKAHVLVTKATHVAKLKRDGSFQLNEVEEGKYTVKVLFNGKWMHEQSLEVAGKEAKLDIKLKPGKKAKAAGGKDKAKDGAK